MSNLLLLAEQFEQDCNLVKLSKIRKLPNGKYRVLSKKNKNLGTYKTREEAVKRLQQVEFFKHSIAKIDTSFYQANDQQIKDSEKIIDLTKTLDFSYSAICRELRQHASKEQVQEFLILFKKEFDKGVKNKLQKPEKIALQNALIKFNKKHKIKLKKNLIKNATLTELGDAAQVGKYLADIVRFTLNKLPLDKRAKALNSLRNKFYSFDANEIAQKELPATASIGQSITFVKHILFNHDAHYIREVLNNIARNL